MAVGLGVLVFPVVRTPFSGWTWVLGFWALLVPAGAALFAFGASSAAGAILSVPALFRERGALSTDSVTVGIVFGVVTGVVMLWAALKTRRNDAAWLYWPKIAILGGPAFIAAVSLYPFLRFTNGFELHQACRLRPAAGAALLGVAALLVLRRSWLARSAAFVFVFAALLPAAAASEWFRRAYARDQLVAWPGLAPVTLAAPIRTWPVWRKFDALELSPAGTGFIGTVRDEARSEGQGISLKTHRFFVFGRHPEPTAIKAVALRFVDEARLLGVFVRDGGVEIRELRVEADGSLQETAWRHPLPSLEGMTLEVDSSGAWRARAPLGDSVRIFEGVAGGSDVRERSWGGMGDALEDRALMGAAGGIKILKKGPSRRFAEHAGWDEALPRHSDDPGTELWSVDAAGRPTGLLAMTRLILDCDEPPFGSASFLCVGTDHWESFLWRVTPDDTKAKLEPVATVKGGVVTVGGRDGAVAALTFEGIVWTDPALGRRLLLPYPHRPDNLFFGKPIIALAPGRIGILDSGRRTFSVYADPIPAQ